jgi:cell division ATPase FtsA
VHSACIIDVTGDATEFGIVEHNLLIDNTYIPYGTQTLIRNVAKAKGNPLADLETQLSEYTRAVCTDETPLGNAVADYRTQLIEGINTILEHRSLPKTILITAHAPYQRVFKEILEHTLHEMGLDTEHEVITLPELAVSEVMDETSPDVYLAMSARFFHKLHGCADITEAE